MNGAADFSTEAAALLNDYAADPTPSTRVLIVTVFGDAIVPHADDTWLGSLSQLLEPLGITDRLVRTSLRRLVAEQLLVNQQEGRRSFYRVHPAAQSTFWRAEQRIYRAHTPAWDGQWTFAIIDAAAAAEARQAIRATLEGLGLGPLTPTTLVSPTVMPEDIRTELQAGHRQHLVLTRATLHASDGTMTDEQVLSRTAPLDRLRHDYEGFIGRYGRLEAAACRAEAIDPAVAFALRTLMVSDYRRIVLADPGVPAELVPENWPERDAAEIAAGLYRALAAPSDRRLAQIGVTVDGPLVPRSDGYANRFTN